MSLRPRARAVPLLAVLALVVVALAGCGGGDDGSARGGSGPGSESTADATLSGVVRQPPLEVASVTLPNATVGAGDAPFTMQAPPGGLLLVYFGYTSCPDICPTTLSDIGRAVKQLPAADRDRIEVAMVTVDPDRDTGQILTSYLDTFVKGRGVALRTTDPAQQQTAQEAFRVVAKRVPDGDTYSFEHTAVTYVVDDTGTVVVEWPFGTSSATMAHDMEILLSGDGQAATR